MHRFLSFFALSAASASTALQPVSAAPSRSWCHSEASEERWNLQEARDEQFWVVRAERMPEAMRTLEQSSAVRISRARAARLTRIGRSDPRGNYYVVRAVVYAPQGSSIADAIRATSDAHYSLLFDNEGRRVILVSQPMRPERLWAHNVAMILRTRLRMSPVLVACYPIP